MTNRDPGPRNKDVPVASASSLQWTRLIRLADSLGLGAQVRHELQDRLLDQFSLHVPQQPAGESHKQKAQVVTVQPPTAKPASAMRVQKGNVKAVTPPANPLTLATMSVNQLEMKIRSLVDASAAWSLMAPYAKALCVLKKDDATKARLLETVFLHGQASDVEEFLKQLGHERTSYYEKVHPAVRAHLVEILWREKSLESLAALLFVERDSEYLLDIEQFYIFAMAAKAKDKVAPFIYFRRHKDAIVAAALKIGASVGFTLDRVWLMAGVMALRLGYGDEAREILSQIKEGSDEYEEALRLVLATRDESKDRGESQYAEMLMASRSPQDRVLLLRQFLDTTRKLGGLHDRNRPALNEILADVLKLAQPDAAIWADLSLLLMQNRDLEGLLPNIFDTFKLYALRFHNPIFDSSLWQGPLRVATDSPREYFWQGVALLHQYICAGPGQEVILWQARHSVAQAKKEWPKALPYSWKDLHKAATGWVSKSPYIMEADRVVMLRQLKIAGEADQVLVSDVKDYLDSGERLDAPVLASLRRLCADKKQYDLELRVLQRTGSAQHFTNANLDRIWQLACHLQMHDLGWRTATVLHARQALSHQVRHAWDISGEKRSDYPFMTIGPEVIRGCLQGFSPSAARLAHAVMTVGPLLPELLALLDKNLVLSKPTGAPSDSVEAQIERLLGESGWVGRPKRRYRLLVEGHLTSANIPAFVQVLPVNPWSLLVARLAEQLGINGWDWKLSKLGSQINDLIPRLAGRQDLRHHSTKVARWLKELTPEQRAAWQDLGTLSRTLKDDEAAAILAKFICRAATLSIPNHAMALTSLQSMRAPIAVFWDLEAFILSESYSAMRLKLGTQNRVMVPTSLQRLESIVKK